MAREHSGQGWSQQTRDRELWGTRGTRGSHSGEKRKQGCVCTMWAATGALSKAEQTQSWWERAMTISRWGVWRLIQALAQSRWWQSLAQRQASQELRGTGRATGPQCRGRWKEATGIPSRKKDHLTSCKGVWFQVSWISDVSGTWRSRLSAADMHNQSLQMWQEVGTCMQASPYAHTCV